MVPKTGRMCTQRRRIEFFRSSTTGYTKTYGGEEMQQQNKLQECLRKAQIIVNKVDCFTSDKDVTAQERVATLKKTCCNDDAFQSMRSKQEK